MFSFYEWYRQWYITFRTVFIVWCTSWHQVTSTTIDTCWFAVPFWKQVKSLWTFFTTMWWCGFLCKLFVRTTVPAIFFMLQPVLTLWRLGPVISYKELLAYGTLCYCHYTSISFNALQPGQYQYSFSFFSRTLHLSHIICILLHIPCILHNLDCYWCYPNAMCILPSSCTLSMYLSQSWHEHPHCIWYQSAICFRHLTQVLESVNP